MKTLIQKVIFSLENDTYLTDQLKCELLKYEICKFAINFSRKLAQNSPKFQTRLESKIKNLEQNITDEDKFNEYKTAKDELENLYDNIATGVKIRSKCDWYQYGEKSTKYFPNNKKYKKKIKALKNDIEITDQLKI